MRTRSITLSHLRVLDFDEILVLVLADDNDRNFFNEHHVVVVLREW